MIAADASGRQLWWTVALETTLFFSLPAWLLTADRAWPADNPYHFALALLLGASAATVLCHVVPAIWARKLSGFVPDRSASIASLPIIAWLCFGAAVSLGQIARMAGRSVTILRQDTRWHVVAGIVMLACALTSIIVAWSGLRRQRAATLLCCGLGVGLLLGVCLAQWPGLSIRMLQLARGEEGLDDPLQVIKGMLLAAAPASVLALRIGKMRVATRWIWSSGLAGVWAPLLAAATLASLAKMFGARMYWKPSLPIGAPFLMALGLDEGAYRSMWILAAVTVVGPCIVCATWVRELTEVWPWGWERGVVLVIALWGLNYGFTDSDGWWRTYYSAWCWSVVVATSLLGLAFLVLRWLGTFHSNASRTD